MPPDYSKWRMVISKKAGKRLSHFGKRGETRGLICKGHSPSLGQIRRALNPSNSIILEADRDCLKSIFRDRSSLGKMKHWTMVFKPNQKRQSVYIVTVRESNNEEIGVYKYQKGV